MAFLIKLKKGSKTVGELGPYEYRRAAAVDAKKLVADAAGGYSAVSEVTTKGTFGAYGHKPKAKMAANGRRRKRNGTYTSFTPHKVGSSWAIYLGNDRYGGKFLTGGLKNKKQAESAVAALYDARDDHAAGRKRSYTVTSRYGYFAVDYNDGAKTATTGLTRQAAKDLALTLRDANNGYLSTRSNPRSRR